MDADDGKGRAENPSKSVKGSKGRKTSKGHKRSKGRKDRKDRKGAKSRRHASASKRARSRGEALDKGFVDYDYIRQTLSEGKDQCGNNCKRCSGWSKTEGEGEGEGNDHENGKGDENGDENGKRDGDGDGEGNGHENGHENGEDAGDIESALSGPTIYITSLGEKRYSCVGNFACKGVPVYGGIRGRLPRNVFSVVMDGVAMINTDYGCLSSCGDDDMKVFYSFEKGDKSAMVCVDFEGTGGSPSEVYAVIDKDFSVAEILSGAKVYDNIEIPDSAQ
jgi:hypothetical protein